ncbi:HAD family hydrolase [Virgibacillus chiguensis]|uniref:Putative hydrolase of the HAD superfamily n=1 Tax=Virgibacillus chiguensis TaxID=411959 RepID=A0A1M5SWD2_9BACI|nr:HAD family hydrolase [Virgibacillus chiguensis]SHH42363.1 putative hydrolase of the HAD superfamily [Virgibacillus chiguensis]
MRTIAFDLDDTLYDRTEPLKQTFSSFRPTKELRFNEILPIYHKYSDIAFEKVTNQQWTLEESYVYRIRKTLQEQNIGISEQDALAFQAMYTKNQDRIQLRPHIEEIIQYLQNKEIQTIIITNGPSTNQRKKVRQLGLEAYFSAEDIIVSEEEAVAKPDPKIFQIAEERFSLTKNETWYIGDNFLIDIIGASQVGWKAIWLKPNHQKPQCNPNLAEKTVHSTEELKDYLLRHV